MLYVLPANPASPKSSLKTLRQIARRAGYLIAADYTTDTFTLGADGHRLIDVPPTCPGLGFPTGFARFDSRDLDRVRDLRQPNMVETEQGEHAIENLKLFIAAVRAE